MALLTTASASAAPRSAGLRPRLHSDRRDAASLLRRFHSDRDEATREALVVRFLPLAYDVARRYQRMGEPLDDLVQVACVGLVKAIDRFDPERGVAFSTYAVPTMIGELKRHFRDTAWAVHLPRSLSERWLAVERAGRELRSTLRRSPTVAEIAKHLDMPADEVLAAMEAGRARGTLSLDSSPGSDLDGGQGRQGEWRPETLGVTDERLDLIHDAVSVANAVHELSPLERQVLRLRFLQEMTQAEIAGHTGVSQMQVSRIIRRALEHLNQRIVPESERP
jgi:RNA polymerase sigma-B factor